MGHIVYISVTLDGGCFQWPEPEIQAGQAFHRNITIAPERKNQS
jgi:hypothetical protein